MDKTKCIRSRTFASLAITLRTFPSTRQAKYEAPRSANLFHVGIGSPSQLGLRFKIYMDKTIQAPFNPNEVQLICLDLHISLPDP